jgi:hypothetical protein
MYQEVRMIMPAITNRMTALVFVSLLVSIPLYLHAGDVAAPRPCDIQHGSCSVTTASGMSIELDVQPKPVKPLSKLQFIVTLTDKGKALTNASVGLDLTMPGMYMGKNAPVMKHISKGRYEGSGIITKCMSGRKTWQADVTVENGAAKDTAGFLFEAQ